MNFKIAKWKLTLKALFKPCCLYLGIPKNVLCLKTIFSYFSSFTRISQCSDCHDNPQLKKLVIPKWFQKQDDKNQESWGYARSHHWSLNLEFLFLLPEHGGVGYLIVVIQLLSSVRLFVTPWTTARQDIISLLQFWTPVLQNFHFSRLISFFPLLFRLKQPRARKMLDEGVIVALGSDFNPNAYCFSMVIIFNMPFWAEWNFSQAYK